MIMIGGLSSFSAQSQQNRGLSALFSGQVLDYMLKILQNISLIVWTFCAELSKISGL